MLQWHSRWISVLFQWDCSESAVVINVVHFKCRYWCCLPLWVIVRTSPSTVTHDNTQHYINWQYYSQCTQTFGNLNFNFYPFYSIFLTCYSKYMTFSTLSTINKIEGWQEDNGTFIHCHESAGTFISTVYYAFFIINLFFDLSLFHMQPGIIAGDEVKNTIMDILCYFSSFKSTLQV